MSAYQTDTLIKRGARHLWAHQRQGGEPRAESRRKEPSKAEMYVLSLIAAVDGRLVEELGKDLVATGEYNHIPEVLEPPKPPKFAIRALKRP